MQALKNGYACSIEEDDPDLDPNHVSCYFEASHYDISVSEGDMNP